MKPRQRQCSWRRSPCRTRPASVVPFSVAANAPPKMSGGVRRPCARPLAERLAEPEQRRAAAVADRRLGDDDRHRQEALLVEQPRRSVERAVLGVGEHAAVLRERLGAEQQPRIKNRPSGGRHRVRRRRRALPPPPWKPALGCRACCARCAPMSRDWCCRSRDWRVSAGRLWFGRSRVPVEPAVAAAAGCRRPCLTSTSPRPSAVLLPVAAVIAPVHVAVAPGVDVVAARAFGEGGVADLRGLARCARPAR